MKTTVHELKTNVTSSTKNKNGSKHMPLLNIESAHYVPDELHLMMRIMDGLLRNLIDDAVSKDTMSKLTAEPTDNLELLIKCIQSRGVTFRTWTGEDGVIDYTSLSGNDKERVC